MNSFCPRTPYLLPRLYLLGYRKCFYDEKSGTNHVNYSTIVSAMSWGITDRDTTDGQSLLDSTDAAMRRQLGVYEN